MQFFPFFFIGTLCFGIMIGLILGDLASIDVKKIMNKVKGILMEVFRIRRRNEKEDEVKQMSSKTFREFAELSLKNYREREEGLRKEVEIHW